MGGMLSVVHTRLIESDHEPLIELTNTLMSMVVLPFLGPAAARRELERKLAKSPPSAPPDESLLSNPFADRRIRLTYRTVRVLVAISDHPGASNRLVADVAEIKDQGQISKLLTRLQRAGLIANAGTGTGQGSPNAWTLTPSGRRVITTIGAHTEGRRSEGGL
jgi:DNA-binding MarR family transcriptional regulator